MLYQWNGSTCLKRVYDCRDYMMHGWVLPKVSCRLLSKESSIRTRWGEMLTEMKLVLRWCSPRGHPTQRDGEYRHPRGPEEAVQCCRCRSYSSKIYFVPARSNLKQLCFSLQKHFAVILSGKLSANFRSITITIFWQKIHISTFL